MSDILTVCLATDEATLRSFLIGQGQTYVATYGPFDTNVVSISRWQPPNIALIGGINQVGSKVLVHTRV